MRERLDERRAIARCTAGNPPPQVQPEVERHLLVARPAGVQPPAGVADALDELALDERVHVLVVGARRSAPDWRARPARIASRPATIAVRRRPATARRRGERLGPGHAAGDVVFDQTAIDGERLAVVEDLGVGRGSKRPDQSVDMSGSPRPHAEREPTAAFAGVAVRQRRTATVRPTTRQSPLKSLSRMVPVTRSCTLPTERVDGLARRREPVAVVDQVGVLHAEVGRQPLEVARRRRTSAARCAPRAAATAAGAS